MGRGESQQSQCYHNIPLVEIAPLRRSAYRDKRTDHRRTERSELALLFSGQTLMDGVLTIVARTASVRLSETKVDCA